MPIGIDARYYPRKMEAYYIMAVGESSGFPFNFAEGYRRSWTENAVAAFRVTAEFWHGTKRTV